MASSNEFATKEIVVIQKMANRLNSGKLLIPYLLTKGFSQITPTLFTHNTPDQVIVLTTDKGMTTYQNMLNAEDKGEFIQFIQNRLMDSMRITPNNDFDTFLGAVVIAIHYKSKIKWARKYEKNRMEKKPDSKNRFPKR